MDIAVVLTCMIGSLQKSGTAIVVYLISQSMAEHSAVERTVISTTRHAVVMHLVHVFGVTERKVCTM